MKTGWICGCLTSFTLIGSVLYTLYPDIEPKSAPTVLRIGVLPDEQKPALEKKYAPLIDYLSSQIDLPIELIIPDNYQDLLTLFKEQEIEMGYFGGATFVRAMHSFNAKPLVMRKVDQHFKSTFIVPATSSIHSIDELEKPECYFSSPLSTSGYVMPDHFFSIYFGQTLKTFCSKFTVTGSHDTTALSISSGSSGLGILNSLIFDSMLKSGRLNQQQVRRIWETPTYPNYVWAVQHHLDESLVVALRNAFMFLDSSIPDQATVLTNLKAHYFIPPGYRTFETLLINTNI